MDAGRARQYSNHLAEEKSPYLLQHAHNPVDWYPWGEEAFVKAVQEDKPIFLSIGYSTCHWCHVMERESFEDTEVAALLNEHYVSIKVDREERPDIDHIYMNVCQAMTGQGGWPLTIIMTPNQHPFFAGTYFPKQKRYGRLGLMGILSQIQDKWRNNRQRVDESGAKILDAVRRADADTANGLVDEKLLHRAYETYKREFDAQYGGFGESPKFPTPHNLIFLLRYGVQFHRPDAIEMVEKTLDAMCAGGMYDHVGFGFARYSTDREWLVPHFEKMLYDNALLVLAYLEGYQVTGKAQYAQVVRDVLGYVQRDMTYAEGAFYSAEDADSEGEEGKFYVWTVEDVRQVLGDAAAARYCAYYSVTPEGNFEGSNIPNLIHQSAEDFAAKLGIPTEQWQTEVRGMNDALFKVREQRVHPYKDDKILASWNGLMIAAMARAGRVLQVPAYVAAAERAMEFIRKQLVTAEGRLVARFREGHSAHLGYVDDYAFLIWGCLELYEATWNVQYLTQALSWQKDMHRLFLDSEHGGFFFTGEDAEQLITRPKEIYDGAMPSGNSVAANNLLRLARMTGDPDLEPVAASQLEAFAGQVARYPAGYSCFLMAVQFALGTTQEIVIAGQADSADTQEMLVDVQRAYLPFAVMLFHPAGEDGKDIETVASFIREQKALQARATAYICENYACGTPITDIEQLRTRIRG